ncbi:MAG: hypothetical protein H0V30_01370 [Chitinophagaceae bacterium]|jgi:hypothetical protein|nr:hypothetical protein [Chitinophagaceae bacterium]
MSENKFENQVQHLMDELKLTPSEEVWPAVKKRISEKRKRRFILFFLPIIAGLILGAVYYYQNTRTSNITENKIIHTPVLTPDPVKENDTIHHAGSPDSEKLNKDQFPVANLLQEEKNHDQKTSQQIFNTPLINDGNKSAEFNSVMKIVDTNMNVAEVITDSQFSGSNNNRVSDKVDDRIIHQEVINNNIEATVSIDTIDAENFTDSLPLKLSFKEEEKAKDTLEIKRDSILIVANEKKSGKWNFGFHFAAGLSKTGNRIIPVNEAMDYNSSPGQGSPILISLPKQSRAGFSFETGFVLQKQLTPRSSILTGLQYCYSSDRLLAGRRYDSTLRLQNSFSSAVNNYYRGNDQWYTNRYHFLELPIHFQYQLNKNSKVPVQWQGGLIFSQLVSTNGLVYDPALSGIYFHDKKLFNRSSLSISSGLSVQVNSKQKIKWSIGPQIKAGVTSLRKSSNDQNQYLLSGGLRVNLFLD